MFEHLLNGLLTAFSPEVLPILIFGVVGGIILGALPGLTATMGVAILLPFTLIESPRPWWPSIRVVRPR